MKKLLLACAFLLCTGCAWSKSNNTTETGTTELTIYTYDSLSADYGLLPKIQEQFETANHAKLNIVSFADTGAMVNQLIAERKDPKADIVLGIDNTDLARYEDQDLFIDPTAFDYGYVGFVYDSEAMQFNTPISLMQLATEPAYKGKIIIEQPGLSSPGTQFLLWAQTAMSEDEAHSFWEALDEQILTVAPDWSTAYYSMFLNGEAPIVLSYLTSPAYHIDQEGTDRYKAIAMTDGYLKQTEYAAEVKRQKSEVEHQAVNAFLNYIVSEPVQNQIATTQWMFPVSTSATLPAAYQQIITPTPAETLMPANSTVAAHYDTWLNQWNGIFGQ